MIDSHRCEAAFFCPSSISQRTVCLFISLNTKRLINNKPVQPYVSSLLFPVIHRPGRCVHPRTVDRGTWSDFIDSTHATPSQPHRQDHPHEPPLRDGALQAPAPGRAAPPAGGLPRARRPHLGSARRLLHLRPLPLRGACACLLARLLGSVGIIQPGGSCPATREHLSSPIH